MAKEKKKLMNQHVLKRLNKILEDGIEKQDGNVDKWQKVKHFIGLSLFLSFLTQWSLPRNIISNQIGWTIFKVPYI
jgi:hypothetical protein